MSGNKQSLPPLPRDHDEASFSEMIPLRSTKIKLWKSPLMLLAVFTALITGAIFILFNQINHTQDVQAKFELFKSMVMISIFYMLLVLMLTLHLYSRTDKPIWFYIFPFVGVCLLLGTPAAAAYFFVYRTLPPGNIMGMAFSNSLVPHWIGMFVGAGLCEEMLKATPVLIAAAFTAYAGRFRPLMPASIYNLVRIRGPLDGTLAGLAAGAAFIFLETGAEWVPREVVQTFRASQNNIGAGFANGLMLLLPRVFQGITGHMGWSAVFGYFIGLAVLRPSRRWTLLAIGYLTASVLHANNNTSGLGPGFVIYITGTMTAVMFIACLLKARQIEASLFGRAAETGGSIIVTAENRPVPVPVPMAAVPAAPPPVASAPVAPPPAAAAAPTVPVTPSALGLSLSGQLLRLDPGVALDLSMVTALAGRGAGVRGEITRHPTNPSVIGLKNLGATAWSARLRDGSVQAIEPGRNLRLAPGVQVDFGNGLVADVVPA